MRVFVTGATGFIGSAVVEELIEAGHQVLGLARSDAGAKSLIAAGAEVHRGDLEDLESLRSGAAKSEGVIHSAFIHDFSKFMANCEIDRHAIEALGNALAGSDRPLIVTSGTALLTPGRLATEDIRAASGPLVSARASEAGGVRVGRAGRARIGGASAATVHGDGDQGFVPYLIAIAREKGVSAYVGEGSNRWPAVHRLDAAQLYRLVLEKGAAGARYHAVGEEGVPTETSPKSIGRRLNVPVVSKSPEEAAAHFGWLAHFAAIDVPGFERTHPATAGMAADSSPG